MVNIQRTIKNTRRRQGCQLACPLRRQLVTTISFNRRRQGFPDLSKVKQPSGMIISFSIFLYFPAIGYDFCDLEPVIAGIRLL